MSKLLFKPSAAFLILKGSGGVPRVEPPILFVDFCSHGPSHHHLDRAFTIIIHNSRTSSREPVSTNLRHPPRCGSLGWSVRHKYQDSYGNYKLCMKLRDDRMSDRDGITCPPPPGLMGCLIPYHLDVIH